jgi:PAS domain S-box-containing protein
VTITVAELRRLFGHGAESESSYLVRFARDGSVQLVSEALLTLLGHSRADSVGAAIDWDDATPAEYCDLDDRCMAQLTKSDAADAYVKELIDKDGSRVAVRVRVVLRDEEPAQIVEFFTELVERPDA